MKEPALALPRNALAHREELEKGRLSHGYVAFCDIKGFTSLTEGLKQLGKEGAGVIASKIDELILPVARAAIENGGNIIAVEGDALLVSFDSRASLLGYCAATRGNRRRRIETPAGDFDVSLDIGIGSGTLYEIVVGTEERRAYVVAGEAIERAYEIEKLSDADVVADAPYAESERVESGNTVGYRLRVDGPLLSPQHAPEAPGGEYALSFIPPLVRDGTFNEFLPVTAAFCDFNLISKLLERGSLSGAGEALNELFAETHRIVELAGGGTIDKFKGYNSLLLFGAPLVHPDDSRRAVEAMAELKIAADRIARRHGLQGEYGRTGLNKGVVYSGEVCGRYTVMGDAVNTAARIKEAGNGDLLISQSVIEDLGAVEARDAGRFSLRGKKERVSVFTFISFSQEERERFVLRKDELEWLRDRVLGSLKGGGRMINVVGDVGSGKDRLLTKLAEALAVDGAEAVELRTSPIQSADPYRTLIELSKKVEGVSGDGELMERLGLGHLRDEKAVSAMERSILSRPRALVISNGDNTDKESLESFRRLGERAREAKVSLVISCSRRLLDEGDELGLENLGPEDTVAFARHVALGVHGTTRFSGDALRTICERSGGNPLFIAELVKSAKCSQEGIFFDAEIPARLEQLLLSNVTKLPKGQRLALKMYSLMYGLDERAVDAFGLRQETEALVAAGVLSQGLEFSNDLLRKVVADQIPRLDKKDYYTRIATVMDGMGLGDDLLLSYYYSNADTSMPVIRAKAVHYLDRYVKGLGDLSVVRVDSLERIARLADRGDPAERKICVDALMGMCKFRHVNATKDKDYREYYKIAREAAKLSEGEPYEYKALHETGRALCWLKKYKRGFALMNRSREMALAAGDLPFYGNIASTYGYALSYTAGRPAEAAAILEEAEAVLVRHISETREIDREFGYTLSTMYFALAECHNKMNDPRAALSYLKKARYYSERFDVHHIFVQTLGTMGEAYYNLGEYRKAEEHCLMADHEISGRRVQMKHFSKELYSLLAAINEKLGNRDRMGMFRMLAEKI